MCDSQRHAHLEIREDFGLSVITSWWQPTNIWQPAPETDRDRPGSDAPLPSVHATLQTGIPAIDYYCIGINEQRPWRQLLFPEKDMSDQELDDEDRRDIQERVASHPGEGDAVPAIIREAFRRPPESARVLHGYTRVPALATYYPDISQRPAQWMFADWGLDARLRDHYWKDDLPPSAGSPRDCPVLGLLAALVVASSLNTPVVEIVCGANTNPPTESAVEADAGSRVMWADLMTQAAMRGTSVPGRRPLPQDTLVDNLFWVATYILTKLPATEYRKDVGHVPPVTLGVEIEHGSAYVVSSPAAYCTIKRQYMDTVANRLQKLQKACGEIPDCFRAFERPRHGFTLTDWGALTELYDRCLGLNVDVGHMHLIGCQPHDLTRYAWFNGVRAFDPNMDCWTGDVFDRDNLPPQPEPFEQQERLELCNQIVHYHLSDHRGAHYCDLPPGEHHSSLDFEGWIRQAYALAQMSGWTDAGSGPSGLIHPNLTRHMALELEASVRGFDRVVSAYAMIDRWIRHTIVSDEPIGGTS